MKRTYECRGLFDDVQDKEDEVIEELRSTIETDEIKNKIWKFKKTFG